MKPFEQQTYYELLEIPVSAPEPEIRAAYARALETYSPDSVAVYTLVDPGQIDALRARLTEAMEILTDSDLRAEYDRMIGVKRTETGVVVALGPALVAAAQAVQPPAAAPASPEPVPSASAAPAAPAPVSMAMPAPSEAPAAVAASSAAPAESPAAPSHKGTAAETPSVAPSPGAVPPGQFVMQGAVRPNQIHAAFRSYALSYVPVLVPASSPATGSAFLSPFPAARAEETAPTQEAPPEAKAAEPSAPSAAPASAVAVIQAPAPAAEPVLPQALAPAGTAEVAAAQRANATAPAPAASVEPAPTSATSAAAEPSQATPAQTSAEPSRPQEPTPAPAATEQPAPVTGTREDNELSGVRAPVPTREETRATPARPGSTPPSSHPGRPGRTFSTPPPLPHGGRRISRSTPTVQPAGSAGDAGRGSARPQPAAGMNLEEAQQLAQESAIATAEAALAQVAAKAREPRPKPIELPPNTEFNGELLRRVRESRNLTLAQLAERTRISSKHLENVEADRYAALPTTVYLRGILMNIARELALDPLRVSRSYLALAADPKKK